MVRVIAKDRIPYADKVFRAGETFEVSEEDAEILLGSETVLKAPPVQPEEPKPRRSKREYNRRDLLAEGSE